MSGLGGWVEGGLITTQKGVESRNGVGYTFMYCVLKGLPALEEFPKLKELIRGPEMYVNSNTFSVSDMCKIDDYICATAGNMVLAANVIHEMKNNWGFIKKPGMPYTWDRWFYRFPGFAFGHVRYALDQRPSAFGRLAWAASIFIAARKPVSEQDGWMQTDLMARLYSASHARTPMCDMALVYWKKRRPAPMWKIFQDYCGVDGHPLELAYRQAGEA